MTLVLRLCFVVVGGGWASIHSRFMETSRADSLMAAVSEVYASWLDARSIEVATAAGRTVSPSARERLSTVVSTTAREVLAELESLLATDVDAQRENPLHVLRRGARGVSEVLREDGVPVPPRDEFETRAMPDDIYGIGPLAWRDLGEHVHEAGIEWGAWKAAVILTRRREEGQR